VGLSDVLRHHLLNQSKEERRRFTLGFLDQFDGLLDLLLAAVTESIFIFTVVQEVQNLALQGFKKHFLVTIH
jgi:hypothetical protein